MNGLGVRKPDLLDVAVVKVQQVRHADFLGLLEVPHDGRRVGAGGVWAACWVQLSWAERVIADPSHRFALVWARLAAELAPAACVATTSCPLIIPPTVSPGGPNYGQDYAGSRRFGRSSVGTRPNLARFPIRPNPGEPR